MAWIELIDTAIKIGLGAIVGGGFSIWTFKLQAKDKNNKFFLEKEYGLILESLENIYHFHEQFRKCVVSYEKNWEVKFEPMWGVIHHISYTITKLNFLGMPELASQTNGYLSSCEQYIRNVQLEMRDGCGDKNQNKIEPAYSDIIQQYKNITRLMNKQFKDKNE